MVFSSITFICVFLPITFIIYHLIPNIKVKNFVLLTVSLVFYAYGEPVYVLLMIASTIFNYLAGLLIDYSKKQIMKKIWLIFSVIANVFVLVVFKYTNMLIATFNSFTGAKVSFVNLTLPIGISFFTFQAMSYVVDVYRKEVKCQKNLFHIMLYISFFPQLIAGPIVKYHDIENQLINRPFDCEMVAKGLRRFVVGLGKKILIANEMAYVADAVFQAQENQLNMISAWIGAVAYLFQIYFDFSGYSDMAIGLGQMFGFHFLENFKHPYVADSIKDFWRRWHISLSTWFKEYVYIPLGGNRKGKFATYRNKLVVFFLTGLWHGANWTFVVWGMIHGIASLVEEAFHLDRLPKIMRRIYTLLIVILAFVIFRADNISQGMNMIKLMFTGFCFETVNQNFTLSLLTPIMIEVMIIAMIGCTEIPYRIYAKLVGTKRKQGKYIEGISFVLSGLLLIFCMLNLASGSYNPFIYFRF
ncbi:MAG: MBOAT family O-acyltransferase [Lachnospiraceae bacterium]